VRQTDRVDVEDLGRVGVGAERGRLAAHDEHVAQAERGRAEQIREHRVHVLAATRVVHDGFDARFPLDHGGRGERAHADARPSGVDEREDVHAGGRERARGLDDLARIPGVRRADLDG
jgi:hypothetical protein